MKNISRKQLGWSSTEKTEWINYILGCNDADICPVCGDDLIRHDMVTGKADGELDFLECLNCD